MSSYMDMFKDGGALTDMFGLGGAEMVKEFNKEMLFTFELITE